eukprot:12927028-Prorocentrum_lima.AAC.1
MDWPARRPMLHRREHGRLLVQGRAAVCETKTCAGVVDGFPRHSTGVRVANGFQFEPGGCDVISRTHGGPATLLS